jgi:hypothetical protein
LILPAPCGTVNCFPIVFAGSMVYLEDLTGEVFGRSFTKQKL